MDDRKWLTLAVALLGVGLAANFIWTKAQIVNLPYGGATDTANSPQSLVDADFVSPVGVFAAPRMYTGAGHEPSQSWVQGGGSSVTSSTGRWAQ